MKKPMEKHVSCLNTYVVLEYLKRNYSETSLTSFLEGIIDSNDFLIKDPVTDHLKKIDLEYLLHLENWVSNQLWNKLFENAKSLTKDKYFAYNAGRESYHLQKLSWKNIAMRYVSVKTIVEKIPEINEEYNRNKQVKIVRIDSDNATVQLHFDKDKPAIKDTCMYNRGIYESLGDITGTPASVEETKCTFEEDDYCEFHIKWEEKSFFDRLRYKFGNWLAGDPAAVVWQKVREKTAMIRKMDDLVSERTVELTKSNQQLKEEITARQKAESMAIQQQKNAAMGRLLYDVSHALKNPMVSITESSDLLSMYNEERYQNLTELLGNQTLFEMREKVIDNAKTGTRPTTIQKLKVQQSLEKMIDIEIGPEILEKIATFDPNGHIASTLLPIMKKYPEKTESLVKFLEIEYNAAITLRDLDISSDNLKGSINSILSLARQDMKPTKFDIHLGLDDIINLTSKKYDKVSFERDYETPLPEVIGYQSQINDAFRNIITNAIEALQGKGTISVKTQKTKDYLEIRITDNGPGIPKDMQDKIMNPFFHNKGIWPGNWSRAL